MEVIIRCIPAFCKCCFILHSERGDDVEDFLVFVCLFFFTFPHRIFVVLYARSIYDETNLCIYVQFVENVMLILDMEMHRNILLVCLSFRIVTLIIAG